MGTPTSLEDLIGDAPLEPEHRHCPVCNQTKPWTAEFWHQPPHGGLVKALCKACHQAKFQAAAVKANRDRGVLAPAVREAREWMAGETASTLARFKSYLEDVNSPHHEWAMQAMIERLLPLKAIAEMAMADAGVSKHGAKGSKPQIQINVLPAQPSGAVAVPAAIEVRAIEDGASDDDEQQRLPGPPGS